MNDRVKNWIRYIVIGTIAFVVINEFLNPKEVRLDSVPSVLLGTWESTDLFVDKQYMTITSTHIGSDRIKNIKGPRKDLYGEYSLYVGSSFFYSCFLKTNGVLDISYVQEGEDRYGSPIYDHIKMGSFTLCEDPVDPVPAVAKMGSFTRYEDPVDPVPAVADSNCITLLANGGIVYVTVTQKNNGARIYRGTIEVDSPLILDKSGPVEIMFSRGEHLVIKSGGERFRPRASGAAKITIE
tara:strand:- start:309 stop:1025 length:717 start_codon:yes stop_codon:yes gene_type:complete